MVKTAVPGSFRGDGYMVEQESRFAVSGSLLNNMIISHFAWPYSADYLPNFWRRVLRLSLLRK